MFDIDSFVRDNIRKLTPYRSARDDFDSGTLLDANENSYGAPLRNSLDLHRYPSPTQDALRQKIADYRGVDLEHIFLGVGSDEPIDLLMRIFCEPGKDSILITPPTYGMYKVAANINNVAVQEVLLTEKFQLRTDEIIEEANENSKLLFLCSPNNPTANDLKRTDLLKLVAKFKGIVVVDEAYIDFSRQESMAQMVRQYPNLVVLQTFSKAFGLAGIRLGVAISNPDIINYMLRVKAPYNINKLTADTALKVFDDMELMKFNINAIKDERDYVAEQLSHSNAVTKVYPSNANFILFKIKNAKEVYRQLAERGVIVRYRGNEPLCEDCLRVTIGMPDENVKFLKALREIVG
ncbi:histidinol-phosphate transaminase [Rhodohalobacter barkolensis]|uniref:Histidinol-phosphate aminotransferase n=1 Tax=Rhodohalobacter barkolensis TaxID=2053187 RepID=A0A2N0VHC5_9BACT|nr:histidinol-phosphate transaminase [Rhodohalobacter barkolensis]PKD43596.1 histidinol-phosphate transaminase [Rhodohalobacter barkolensis]